VYIQHDVISNFPLNTYFFAVRAAASSASSSEEWSSVKSERKSNTALTGFSLGPFNNSVRQLTFSVPIVNDVIPEDDETFIANLTLLPADQARLRNRVTVQPDSATVTIQDDEGTTYAHNYIF